MEPELKRLKQRIVDELEAENWQEALALLTDWCERFPRDARAWANLGYCQVRLRMYSEALLAVDRAIEHDPGLETAHHLREHVMRRLGPRAPAPAEGQQRETVRLDAVGSSRLSVDGSRRGTRSIAQPTYGTRPAAEGERVWRERSIIAGRYDVLEVLRGGMGMVYIAFDRELQRVVAVKTPLPSVLASDEGRARFHREAEAWIALGHHPNICSALYVQEIGGMPRLFIEYVDGGDLEKLLKRQIDLDMGQRLDIAIQIASGVDYTHSFSWTDDEGVEHHGLVHRDLKPANVLLTQDRRARVTDFGLVRAVVAEGEDIQLAVPADLAAVPVSNAVTDSLSGGSWQTVTEAGGVLGTPPYLAPELWRRSARATPASDMYAFGCILYEIFCGRRPFATAETSRSNRAAQLAQWMRHHVGARPPDPTELAPGLDGELAQLMVACLAKQPHQRPSSFASLRERLVEIFERQAGRKYHRQLPRRGRLLADSLNNRAVSYITLGNLVLAEEGLSEALRVEPSHLEATYNLCLLEWRTRGLTDAEMTRRLEEARKASREESRGLHLLGRIGLLTDDSSVAMRALQEAREAGGLSLELLRDRGLALLAGARSTGSRELYVRAASELEALIDDSGTELISLVGRADALRGAGDPAGSESLWRSAREQAPDLPDELTEAASLLLPGHRAVLGLDHSQPLRSVALLSSDRLACRDDRGWLSVWDLGTGALIGEFELEGEPGRGRSIAAIPGTGRVVVTFTDRPMALLDLGSGQRIGGFRTHPGQPTCVAVTPDARRLVTGGSDRKVRLWDVATGSSQIAFEGHDAFVSGVLISDDGSRVLSAAADGVIRLWDTAVGRCMVTLTGHKGGVHAIDWLPDRQLVASGGADCTARLWDLESGEQIATMVGHGAAVTDIRMVAGEPGMVLTGSGDRTARVWDLVSGVPLRIVRRPSIVSGVLATDHGRTLLVVHGSVASVFRLPEDVSVRLSFALAVPLEASELERRERQFRDCLESARARIEGGDHRGAFDALTEARAVEGYAQNPEALELWQLVLRHFPTGRARGHTELCRYEGHAGAITDVTFSRDGARGVSAGVDGSIRLWDVRSSRELVAIRNHGAPVTATAVSPLDARLVSAARDGTLRLWSESSEVCEREIRAQQGAIAGVCFTPCGGSVVTAGEDGSVLRWGITEPGPPELIGRHPEAVSAIAVSADGEFVVSGGWDREVVVWNLERGAELRRLPGHVGTITALAISPDCRLLASAADDGTVRIWDRVSGRLRRLLEGHRGSVLAIDFTPDARFLVSGGRDETLRVWDVRTGSQSRVIEGHTGPVAAVRVGHDGQLLLSAGADAVVRLWLLDWEPEVSEAGTWDDRVRPFLEVFLRRQPPPATPTEGPSWDRAELDALMTDLGRRGFGWLDRARVERELEQLSSTWRDRRSSEQRLVRAQAQRQQRRRTLQPARELVAGLTRNLTAKLVAAVLVVIAGPLLIMSVRSPDPVEATFNDTLYHQVALAMAERGRRLAHGTVLGFQGDRRTVFLGGAEGCAGVAVDQYLQTALHPERVSPTYNDPAVEAGDEAFRLRYHQSVSCLGDLGDSSALRAILDDVDRDLHPYQVEDLLSVLVRAGPAISDDLVRALSSPSVAKRHLAALALAYSSRPGASAPLVAALDGDQLSALEAASFVLGELIVHEVIPEDDAFAVAQRLAHSIDPRVRRNAMRSLILFQHDGPVRDLLDEGLDDSDGGVVRAALETRNALRAATAKKYFGIDLDR
jgi:WD40 repeat protein/serine/threonine protein kinase